MSELEMLYKIWKHCGYVSKAACDKYLNSLKPIEKRDKRLYEERERVIETIKRRCVI